MLIVSSRVLLALLLGLGAYSGAVALHLRTYFSSPWYELAFAGIVVVGVGAGYVTGGVVGKWFSERMRAIDREADKRSAAELIVAALGLVVGLVVAALLGIAVAQLPIIGPYVALVVALVVAYIFSRIGARKHVDILRLLGIRSRQPQAAASPRIVDTSAIIDGRLVDVVQTRFLTGSFVVPAFVLEELQKVADSSDPLKRARGRRGLELVEELKRSANGGFSVREGDYADVNGVDAKLVRMATDLGGAIVTTDFNLNKVAQIQGVEVLNLNDLANALKPAVLPGEPLHVKVLREGREFDQGVGYLDDGTMIVVEGGRGLVGKEVDVEVTSVLQSSSGKMIFTKTTAGTQA